MKTSSISEMSETQASGKHVFSRLEALRLSALHVLFLHRLFPSTILPGSLPRQRTASTRLPPQRTMRSGGKRPRRDIKQLCSRTSIVLHDSELKMFLRTRPSLK